MKVST